tara:strand:- start:235 stop:336 length:102 start_codon:yes stop_codon:yes gene_type:complete
MLLNFCKTDENKRIKKRKIPINLELRFKSIFKG